MRHSSVKVTSMKLSSEVDGVRIQDRSGKSIVITLKDIHELLPKLETVVDNLTQDLRQRNAERQQEAR